MQSVIGDWLIELNIVSINLLQRSATVSIAASMTPKRIDAPELEMVNGIPQTIGSVGKQSLEREGKFVALNTLIKRMLCRHESKLTHVLDVHGDKRLLMPRNTCSIWLCPRCGKYLYKEYLGKDIIFIPETDMGTVPDGYHTFNELYDHRARLFAAICNDHSDISWKSKVHDDGTMYNNMFIVGINSPLGQITYHYDIYPYWDLFDVKELDKAPKWDGHTSDDVLVRIGSLKWLKK